MNNKSIQSYCVLDPLIGIRAVSEIGCESDPGDCSVQECKELQARVNRLKGGRKCLDSDSILEIQTKIIEFANLRKARININQRCYKGGDAGHQQAVEDAGRAIENCGAKLNKL